MSGQKITGGPCKIRDCERPVIARGWCGAHYAKWQKYGDPLGTYVVHGNVGRRYVVRQSQPSPNLLAASETAIAWAAGLFEGEGSVFGERKHGRRRLYVTPRMSLNSTDLDVVERFQRVVGGRIHHEPQAAAYRKDQWKLTVQGIGPVAAVYERFRPWLQARRRGQFESALAEYEALARSL